MEVDSERGNPNCLISDRVKKTFNVRKEKKKQKGKARAAEEEKSKWDDSGVSLLVREKPRVRG